MLDSGGWLRQAEAGDTAAMDRLRTVNRLIAASPDLQAREQLAVARATRALAGEEPVRLAADIRALTRQALALLEHGLGDYGAGSPPSR